MYVPFPESMRTLQDSVLKTAVLISSLYTAALAKVGVIALRSRSWKGHWPMDLSIVKWVGDDMRKMWAGGSGKYAKMSNSLNGSNEFHSRSSSRSLGRCHAGWCCSSSDCSDSGWGTGLRDNEKTSENLGQPVTGADHAATFESALQLQHVTRTRNHWCGHGDVAWSEVWHFFLLKDADKKYISDKKDETHNLICDGCIWVVLIVFFWNVREWLEQKPDWQIWFTYSRCSPRLPEDYATRYQLVICFCISFCVLVAFCYCRACSSSSNSSSRSSKGSAAVAGVETVD